MQNTCNKDWIYFYRQYLKYFKLFVKEDSDVCKLTTMAAHGRTTHGARTSAAMSWSQTISSHGSRPSTRGSTVILSCDFFRIIRPSAPEPTKLLAQPYMMDNHEVKKILPCMQMEIVRSTCHWYFMHDIASLIPDSGKNEDSLWIPNKHESIMVMLYKIWWI